MRAEDTDWRGEERELLRLVAVGLTNKEIAGQRGVSETAIKKRLCALMRRLEAPNRAALVRAAFVLGVLDDAEPRHKASARDVR
jgi:DNA-binding NarL/FixJ family response regulator